VSDDWAGWASAVPDPDFRGRRTAAFRAFYENLPLPASCRPTGPDIQLYRRLDWGALATLHLLDTRQYRPDQPCGGRYGQDCPDRHDPARDILGATQEGWLLDGFRRSVARWDLLAQQVMFSQLDLTRGPGTAVNTDAWDGYVAGRDRVVDGWRAAGVRNPVVLTGDVHAAWAAEVRARFDDPAAPVVGTELVTTSIASGGDGSETRDDTADLLAENPHMRFFNNRRGYLRARLTPETLTAEFRAVEYVSRPGAPVGTRASFVVEDRRAGLNQA
jgi:alkaline phosphatase D